MTNSKDGRIAWIDCELTGLNPFGEDKLLQVALIVTDNELNELSEGFEKKVFYDKETTKSLYDQSDEIVKKMHSATGLWGALESEGVPMEDLDKALLEELKKYIPNPRTAELGGNSITIDRNSLNRNLPKSYAHLYYRSYDMSSVAKYFRDNAPSIPAFEKKKTHEALDDIRESIAEARHYANFAEKFGL